MRCAKSILGLAALGFAPLAAHGQSTSSLLTDGDTIIGMGAFTSATFVGITNDRLWSTLIDTNFGDTSRDGAVLRNGFVMLREGTAMFSPPGSRLGEWFSINMNSNGDLAQIIRMEVSTGILDGLFWNLVPLAVKGTEIVSPLVGAGTTWDNFAAVKIDDHNRIYVLGEVANPAVAGNREDALLRYEVDALGNVLSYEVLATKGSFVAPLGSIVDTLGSSEHVIGINDNGDYITFVGAVGARSVLINMESVVAQEGTLTSTGKNWATLTLTKVAINNRGDYLVTGAQEGQVFLIEKNGQKFAEAGDVIPTLSLAPLANGTPAPVYLTETGDVFWNARFSGVNDDAFCRNYEAFIQRNVTLINGNLVTTIVGDENSFAISKNGRFFAGRVQIQPTRNVVAFVDFGLVLEIPGCHGNTGTLTLDSGKALVGGQFKLALDNGQVPGAIPVLAFSGRAVIPGSPCGVVTQYGEILISPQGMTAPIVLPPWNGSDPAIFTANIPNTVSLVDAVFFAQGAFRDPAQPSPEKYRLTNAVRIEFGPP